MYVCICNPVTDTEVRACARRGACTLSDLQAQLGVALQCGMCASVALEIVEDVTGRASARDTSQLQAAA